MKNRIFTMVLMSLILLSSRAFSAELGMARMGIVEGDVQIYAGDAGTWVPASINTPLGQGDRVWVPAGARTELQFQGGLRIRLDAATSFDLLALDNNAYQFYLNGGRSYINNRTYGIDHLQIDTPVSSIGCYDNSVTMIDVSENGATEISVLKGYAYAETRNGKVRIPAGKTLRIEENLTAQLFPLSSPDEWEEWNRNLDARIGTSGSSGRYLPEELYDYGQDFDNYGRWLYDSSYGYVWTPTFAISINWAPYHVGRWVWIGGQYVWISQEPWGWAPYHYGRWIHRPHVGWCWVPPRRGAVYWGPGFVGWVYTPNYVAWVPLAPGDIYYGRGYYGPGSVNINTIVTNNIVINRTYVNRDVRNAVRVMHRNTFLHGKKAPAPAWDNPFRQRNVGIGPPRFKPDKATYAPALKTIPAAKLPPQRIRKFSPDSLRQERKLVPDKRGSVFAPGSPVREMPATVRETPRKILREQTPEYYRDRQVKPKAVETPQKQQLRQDAPAKVKKPVTIITPTTRTKTRSEKSVPAPRQLQQPATIKAAPQPIAPQPVAPTPIWSPPSTSQPHKNNSPVGRQAVPIGDPRILRQSTPAAPQVQRSAPQPRQQQQQIIRQEQQTIRRLQPVTPQPTTTQVPANRSTTPATTAQPRQNAGQAGERVQHGQGNVKGNTR